MLTRLKEMQGLFAIEVDALVQHLMLVLALSYHPSNSFKLM